MKQFYSSVVDVFCPNARNSTADFLVQLKITRKALKERDCEFYIFFHATSVSLQ